MIELIFYFKFVYFFFILLFTIWQQFKISRERRKQIHPWLHHLSFTFLFQSLRNLALISVLKLLRKLESFRNLLVTQNPSVDPSFIFEIRSLYIIAHLIYIFHLSHQDFPYSLSLLSNSRSLHSVALSLRQSFSLSLSLSHSLHYLFSFSLADSLINVSWAKTRKQLHDICVVETTRICQAFSSDMTQRIT